MDKYSVSVSMDVSGKDFISRLQVLISGPEEINYDEASNELRELVSKWASTWLRYSGFSVTIERVEG